MNKLNDFLNESEINNIYNGFTNIFIIHYDKEAIIGEYLIGSLLLKVNITKDKSYIKINDFIIFRKDKIKWTNTKICLVDPYWVKPFINDEKLDIKVKVLKSRLVGDERIYYSDYEYIKLTYKQFIKRRLLETLGNKSYLAIEGFFNFRERRPVVGYYKALNETSKHYLIKHDELSKVIIPKINNFLKEVKKEWDVLYIQAIKNDKAKQAIEKLIKSNKKVNTKVIEFKKTS